MSETEPERPEAAPENGASPDPSEAGARLVEAEARAEQHRADFLRAIDPRVRVVFVVPQGLSKQDREQLDALLKS